MYAIIETGGKQYKVAENDRLNVEKIDAKAGDSLELDKVLFVAGLLANEIDGPDGPDTSRGAALLALSATDGAELGRRQLDSTPVLDGMAAAYGRLYISMKNGSLLCLGK